MKNNKLYQYTLSCNLPMDRAQEILFISIKNLEHLIGRPQVRMDVHFVLDKSKRLCTIDAGTKTGLDVCRLFTGFMTDEFGDESFKVKYLE